MSQLRVTMVSARAPPVTPPTNKDGALLVAQLWNAEMKQGTYRYESAAGRVNGFAPDLPQLVLRFVPKRLFIHTSASFNFWCLWHKVTKLGRLSDSSSAVRSTSRKKLKFTTLLYD
jgi:hypothetical protein